MKLVRAVKLVNQFKPFLIRRNRQLGSIPAHSESGLQVERFFRTTTAVLTQSTTTLAAAIAAELGITLPAAAILTLKEVHIYAADNIDVAIAYAVDSYGATDGLASVRFSDASDSYFASVEVVYPVNCRPTFRADAATASILTLSGAGTYVIDYLVSVSVPSSTAGRLVLPGRKNQLARLTDALERLQF